ncbi:aminodeoxychorismate synthase component I [Psychrobium sp. nBUS_13]|uniref:aminodeoxychorismate synthase component I n=1 Tax=Psychrobium sp. nBUS_13 TaxID=3395319 RepID=UPI003EBC1BAC
MSAAFQTSPLNLSISSRELFKSLAHLPWAMLLDSGCSNHVDAHFDIIVFDPIMTLSSDDDTTTIVDKQTGHTKTSSKNPFDVLAQELALFDFCVQDQDLPFTGGALGLFGYDLGRHCESINSESLKDIELPVMAVGIYKHALIFDRRKDTISVVSQSNVEEHQHYINAVNSYHQKELHLSTFSALTAWEHQINRDEYSERFHQVQRHLRAGDCYQINLTQRFSLTKSGDEYAAYQALAAANETPFSAFVRLENFTVLSLSPERFLQTKHQTIETKPIKGTMPRSKDPVEDLALKNTLRASEKDQSENLMIVDLLRNDIGRSAVAGSVQVPKLFDIESFENVHHLVSTITAQLPSDVSPIKLLRDAFPGGSITGAPKISAMNIIDTLEPSRRSIYCGSVGYISANGNMDTSITIRTVLSTKDTMYCWAGGGIVADSTADAEYQECFDKLASIMPVLSGLDIRN